MDAIASGMRYYPYYLEAYGAVLNGLLGLYETEIAPEDARILPSHRRKRRPIRDGQAVWVSKYGLKAFSPIASGFPTANTTTSASPAATVTRGGTWATT